VAVGLALGFRRMGREDLPLLYGWLERPHVKRWYRDHGDYDDVVAHYGPALDGGDPTDHYIVELAGRPIGMVQTYLVADYPDYAKQIGIDDLTTAGVDILIGVEQLTGQGLGTEILTRFVRDVVFERAAIVGCVADPDSANYASLRAFEKAGFRAVKTFKEDPGDGEIHTLLRLDRHGAQRAPR
jgi:RimJ/RimL family protein N-acetyltransferase